MSPIPRYRLPTQEEIASCRKMLPKWISKEVLLLDLMEKVRTHLPDPTIGNHAWVVFRLWDEGIITPRFDLIPGWQDDEGIQRQLLIEKSKT